MKAIVIHTNWSACECLSFPLGVNLNKDFCVSMWGRKQKRRKSKTHARP